MLKIITWRKLDCLKVLLNSEHKYSVAKNVTLDSMAQKVAYKLVKTTVQNSRKNAEKALEKMCYFWINFLKLGLPQELLKH